MKHRVPVPAAAAVWILAACARPEELPAPEPLPLEMLISEDDVRAFLGVDPELREFLAAEADEERAAEEADRVAAAAAALSVPADPADFDIPIQYNERVRFWMDYFQDRGGEHFSEYLARMGRYGPYIRSRLRERGMPEDLVYLALIESGFSPVARSHARAVGIWQFIAETGRRYGLEVGAYVDERRDPIRSTEAALNYLEKLYGQFGSWYLAAAAYNTGENRVERILRRHAGGGRGDDALFWRIDQHLPRETRNYVPKLVAAAILARYPDRFGFGDVAAEAPLSFDVVSVPDATDLAIIAEAAGADEVEVERLNPQFVRRVTPPGRKVEVRVPAGRGADFAVAYAEIPPSRRVRILEHTVRRGETLSHIARRYGTTVRNLQQINGIRNPNAIRAGHRLIVRMGPAAVRGTRAATATGSARPRTAGADAPGGRDRTGTTADAEDAVPLGPGARPARSSTAYTVRRGDSLWSIARRHGVSIDVLLEWNRLDRDVVLHPGDRIEVPAGR